MNQNKPSYEDLEKRIKELESELKIANTQNSIDESYAQFKLVFENSKNAILWADAKTGIIIRANKSALEMLERDIEDIVGKHFTSIHPEHRIEKDILQFKDHVEKKADNLESEIITKSGKIKLVEVSSTVVKIGEKEINQGVFIDITEKKQSEELLRKSEEKYRQITETLPAVIFELDLEGNITFINSMAYELTGYSKKDVDEGFNVLSIVIPEDKIRVAENMKKLLMGEELAITDYTFVHKDGSNIPVILHSTPITENNKPIGFRGFFMDISERKNAELTIQKQNAKLVELNAAKDKLFSIIAHDLKSPFNVILGFSNLLFSNIDRFNKEKIHKIASTLNNAAIQTNKLLENLLDWSRFQRGLVNVNLTSCNFKVIAFELELLYFELAKNKLITIQNNIIDNIIVKCDEDITKAILRNLISNAIKFTNKGGKISMDYEKNEDFVTFSITDNGVGIDKKRLPYLFDLSQNSITSGTDYEKGTGLGLILCKELVEIQGGKIWIDSEIGKGTKISFTLTNTV